MNPILWFLVFVAGMVLVIVIWPVGLLVGTKSKTVTRVEQVDIPQVTVHADFGKDLRDVSIEDL